MGQIEALKDENKKLGADYNVTQARLYLLLLFIRILIEGDQTRV